MRREDEEGHVSKQDWHALKVGSNIKGKCKHWQSSSAWRTGSLAAASSADQLKRKLKRNVLRPIVFLDGCRYNIKLSARFLEDCRERERVCVCACVCVCVCVCGGRGAGGHSGVHVGL